MKKKYIKLFVEFFKDFHGKIQENDKQLSELFEKIIVWIIGLSTGTIVFIISSIEKLNFSDKRVIGYTFLLLTISIISGITGRISQAVAKYISFSQSALFDFELKLLEFPRDIKLEGTETAEMIYEFLIEDFDFDYPFLLSSKKEAPKEKWLELDELARKIYQDYSKLNIKARNEVLADLELITIKSFGLKQKAFEKPRVQNNRLKGIISRFLTSLSYVLYFICALSFCFAISYFAFSYLTTLNYLGFIFFNQTSLGSSSFV